MHAPLDPGIAQYKRQIPRAWISRHKVGFYTDDGFLAASPSVARGVEEAAKLMENAGATVVPSRPHHKTNSLPSITRPFRATAAPRCGETEGDHISTAKRC